MTLWTVIGFAAAAASTASFAPQAWKIIRTRDTRAISGGMYVLTVAAFALWTAYGLGLRQWPLVASNAICLALAGFILLMKLLPRREKEKIAKSLGQ